MYSSTKSYVLSTAHRLWEGNYRGKCRSLHGHSFIVTVTIKSKEVDSVGFVVDFGGAFSKVKDFLFNAFDHGTVLCVNDPLGRILNDGTNKVEYLKDNPTCENLAAEIRFQTLLILEDFKFDQIEVSVQEGPDGGIGKCF